MKARIVTVLLGLGILAATLLGVALVLQATPSEAASSSSATGVWTAYTPAPTETNSLGRHKHPPSVNPCDDFALGMVVLTVVLGVVYYRRRSAHRYEHKATN